MAPTWHLFSSSRNVQSSDTPTRARSAREVGFRSERNISATSRQGTPKLHIDGDLPPPPPYTPESNNGGLAPPADNGLRRSRSAGGPITSPSTPSSLAIPTSTSPLGNIRRARSHSRVASPPATDSQTAFHILPAPGNDVNASSSFQAGPFGSVGGFRVELAPGDRGSRYTRVVMTNASPSSPSNAPFAGNQTTESNLTNPSEAPLPPTPTPQRTTPQRRSTREDLLELLKKFNTVIIVDDSSSMAGRRWAEARAALADLAEVASQYDVDGIDVYFLNDTRVGSNLTSARAVEQLFDQIDPDGITPTGEKLEELLLAYLLEIEAAQDSDKAGQTTDALKKIKPANFIVLTDGAPTDDPESVIVTAAKRLDARHFPLSQVGIQFVQIGSDASASEALKELDDGIAAQHGIRDIVDTTPYSPDRGQLSSRDIAKILLGGINRRIDKRGAGG